MSCIMFLVIANKNLFLFSKCRASVLFARLSLPLVASRWRQRTLGELAQVHGREPGRAGEAKREPFSPPQGSWRAVNLEQPTPGQRCQKMEKSSVQPLVQPLLPASVGGPSAAYFSRPPHLGRVFLGCALELELVSSGRCVLAALRAPTAHLRWGSRSDLVRL